MMNASYDSTLPASHRRGHSVLIPLVCAWLVHLACILLIGHYRNPALLENGAIARQLLEGRGFSGRVFKPSELERRPEGSKGVQRPEPKADLPGIVRLQPTSNQAPGYPFLLYGWWRVFGQTTAAYLFLSILQALLLATIVIPVGWLARRWCGSRARTFAIWMAALFPAYLYYGTRLNQVAINCTLYPWLLAGWLRLADEPARAHPAALGVLTGAAAWFQPIVLGPMGILGAVLWWRAARCRAWRTVRRLGLAAVFVVLTVAPWIARGYLVHDQFVPLKNSFGKELWIGNNPAATGTSTLADRTTSMYSLYFPMALHAMPEALEMTVMNRMRDDAMRFIRADYAAFARRTALKIAWFWTQVPSARLSADSDRVRFAWLQVLYWFPLLLLSAIGIRSASREFWSVALIFVLVYSTVYGLTFVDHSRFRLEIEFLFIIAAAQGLVCLGAGAKALRRRLIGTPGPA